MRIIIVGTKLVHLIAKRSIRRNASSGSKRDMPTMECPSNNAWIFVVTGIL